MTSRPVTLRFSSLMLLSCFGISLLTGCQMVSVKQQELTTSLNNERDSILTRDRLSEGSLNVLSMTNQQGNRCIEQPKTCLDTLQQTPQLLDEQALSTGSELYLAHAIFLKQSRTCQVPKQSQQISQQAIPFDQDYRSCLEQQINALNQSIRYSYAYLFATERPLAQRLFDNRQVQVRDFYNQAVANLLNTYNELKDIQPTDNHQTPALQEGIGLDSAPLAQTAPSTSPTLSPQININKTTVQKEALKTQLVNQSDLNQVLNVGDSQYHIDISQYPTLDPRALQKLISTYNLSFSGLTSISRRDGFGSEFALQLKTPNKPSFTHYQIDPFLHLDNIFDHPNIHAAKYLPATLVIEPQYSETSLQILQGNTLRLKVIDPNLYQDTMLKGQKFPLAANFSAPYGLWLANDNFSSAAYKSLFDRDQSLLMPHLFMLEPYNPKKRIIVMIHGLASSPEAWIAMTNDMMGDPVLRDHYQVWQIFYSTNIPIVESRYQIYALLQQAFNGVGKQAGQHPQHAVLIGHSMGGIISRLLVSNTDLEKQVLDSLTQNSNSRYQRLKNLKIAESRLKLNALTPPIDRAIFIASPFKGTDFADRWYTRTLRRIIRLPQGFLNAFNQSLSQQSTNNQQFNQLIHQVFQHGVNDLSQQSLFMKITTGVTIDPDVRYHTIIGNDTDSDHPMQISDGIVPYASAHLDGAISEKVIKGGHSIQYTPEAVLELRRILRLHLKELGEYQP